MVKGRVGLLHVAFFAVALALGTAAAFVLYPTDPASRIFVTLAIAVGFVVAGPLGFCLLLRKFQFGEPDDRLFTIGFLVRDLPWVVFGHIVLAYPTGRLQRRRERAFAVAAYAIAVALPLAALLVHEPHPDDEVAGASAIAAAPSADAFDALRAVEAIAVYGLLPLVLLGLIWAKVAEASPRARRMYAVLAYLKGSEAA
jgi:hypothetical protein